jgi:hypothetical protein
LEQRETWRAERLLWYDSRSCWRVDGEAKMRVSTTDLDGYPLGQVDLTRSGDDCATVNGQAVIAMRPLGSRVTLVVDRRQYCVSVADYWRVMSTAGSATAHRETD